MAYFIYSDIKIKESEALLKERKHKVNIALSFHLATNLLDRHGNFVIKLYNTSESSTA